MNNEIVNDDIAKKMISFFTKKHGEMIRIKGVDFSVKYSHKDHQDELEKKYHIYLSYESTDSSKFFWDQPSRFESKISFENAFDKAKILVSAYVETVLLDKTFDENIVYINTLIKKNSNQLTKEDLDILVNYHIKIENFHKVVYYKDLLEKKIS